MENEQKYLKGNKNGQNAPNRIVASHCIETTTTKNKIIKNSQIDKADMKQGAEFEPM